MEALSGLDESSTSEQWLEVLSAFNQTHEDAWKISEKYGEDCKREVAAKLKAYVVAYRNDDSKLAASLAQALCACRIFLRERIAVEALMSVEFLEVLLALCTTGDAEYIAAEVPANALKSTINVLYNNPPLLHAFNQMQGPHALLEVVKQSRPLTVHWLTIRTIHMLVSASDSFCQLYFQLGVLDALVTELAFLVRCENPPFPHGKDRLDCMKEIFKVLFALRNFLESRKLGDSINNDPVFAQLGALLVQLLKMPNSNPQVYQLKLEAVDLLIFMPREFGYVLLLNDVVPALMDILSYQLTSVLIETESDGARTLAPVLIVCTNFVQSSPAAKQAVKRIIFPNPVPEPLPGEESKGGDLSRKNMAPRDAPRHTLRYYLIQLMTSLEALTKRYATELLYALCDNDDEFVARTGFGNAVAMLRLRGLLG